MELMDFVDGDDNVLGQASKADVYEKLLTHRIVHVFVLNEKSEIALQMRSASCSYCPLHWSMSAAGHVSAGEDYETGAARELQEELGIDAPISFLKKDYNTEDPRGVHKFIAAFFARHNGPFDINPEEVDRVEWYTAEQIEKMIADGEPFHPQFAYMFSRCKNQLGL